jgi:hypothetical protein
VYAQDFALPPLLRTLRDKAHRQHGHHPPAAPLAAPDLAVNEQAVAIAVVEAPGVSKGWARRQRLGWSWYGVRGLGLGLGRHPVRANFICTAVQDS